MVPLGAGSDNSAFLVNDAFVFRFPRRQLAVELLETEVRVLPALAPALPLAIPVPRLVGSPGSDVPLAFAGDSFLPGRTAIEEDDGRLARFRPPFTPSRSRFTQTPKGTRRSGERR
jgi:aminoglycoside phosphotransferase (APT) family kinase protein